MQEAEEEETDTQDPTEGARFSVLVAIVTMILSLLWTLKPWKPAPNIHAGSPEYRRVQTARPSPNLEIQYTLLKVHG